MFQENAGTAGAGSGSRQSAPCSRRPPSRAARSSCLALCQMTELMVVSLSRTELTVVTLVRDRVNGSDTAK